MDSRRVFLADAAATIQLGRTLVERWLALPAAQRPLLLLEGDLGAGKTCLVQGIASGLGIDGAVTSPSFALAQHYSGSRGSLVHLDLYRLELPAAADELFAQEAEEALALGALLAVEWPGRLSAAPAGAWRLELMLADPMTPEAGRLALLRDAAGTP